MGLHCLPKSQKREAGLRWVNMYLLVTYIYYNRLIILCFIIGYGLKYLTTFVQSVLDLKSEIQFIIRKIVVLCVLWRIISYFIFKTYNNNDEVGI